MSGDNYKTYLGETESRFRIRSSEFENFKKTEPFPLLILMADLVFYTDYRVYLNSDGEQFFMWREPAY